VKSWCIPEITAEFLQKMEHILWLYALPDDLLHPLVCFDEKSIQLLAQTRPLLDCKSGLVARQDHEYKRNGTRNLFMLVAPKRGERNVLVTQRRTKIDFALVMRYLVDVMCIPRLNTSTWSWTISTLITTIHWSKHLANRKQIGS